MADNKRLTFRDVVEIQRRTTEDPTGAFRQTLKNGVGSLAKARPLSKRQREDLEFQRRQIEAQERAKVRAEAQRKAQAELERKRQVARDRAKAVGERIARERKQIEELKKLSKVKQREFFRQQELALRGQSLLRLQAQGKKLSPKNQKIAEREFQRQGRGKRESRVEGFVVNEFQGRKLDKSIIINKRGVPVRLANQNEIKKLKEATTTQKKNLTKRKIGEAIKRFGKGFQKVAVTKKFRSKDVKAEQKKKEKDFKRRVVESKGKIDFSREIQRSFEDKDVATFSKITGATTGIINPVVGASFWAVGDVGERIGKAKEEDKGKITKKEFKKIVLDSATKGAILGFLMKAGGHGLDIAGKKILTKVATRNTEKKAVQALANHGGQLIKISGKGGKNAITTYFYKDIAGNVFEATLDVKSGKFNNALRKGIQSGSNIGGFVAGGKVGKKAVKGALVVRGKFKPTLPEKFQKKIPLDVMAKQLLSKGKIVLTRRGVWETGRGLVPRKDAWGDAGIKVPTKGIFWRFDKTLDKKGDAISPLPLFTKDKSKYWVMFKRNWHKNRGMGLVKRYIKTTAETPVVDDILIRKTINIKSIKNKTLRNLVIKEFATKGKLTKATQNKVLKAKLPISDKNRERGFHDENEFVTRKLTKLKNKKDISWTFDKNLNEYIPVVQSLKDAGRIKNLLTVLTKKKIITKTDAKFIKDNFALKKKFREKAVLPREHSFNHMKNVEKNIVKLMDKYPEFNKHWKKKYGSIANAKKQLKKAMWHDIGKTSESSKEFGTAHGQKVWNVWKAGLLPKGIKLKKGVAKAIKVHEVLDPRKIRYNIRNRVGAITPEQKIVATADRLDLVRFGIKIDEKRLPLKDAIKRLKLSVKVKDYPKSFSAIIKKIKSDQKVSAKDVKKLISWRPKKIKKPSARLKSRKPSTRPIEIRPTKRRPTTRSRTRAGGRTTTRVRVRQRPRPRITTRTTTRPPKRPPTRPPIRTTTRPPKRPPRRPPSRPPRKPPKKLPEAPPTIRFRKEILRRQPTKPQPVFNVFGKSRGKFVRLNRKPLSRDDALSKGAFAVDVTTAKTFQIKPAGKSKKPGSLNKKERNYFNRQGFKLREFRIKKGRKFKLKDKFIEKTKFGIDTKTEKSGLSIAKFIKQQRRETIRKKRKITSAQRKVLLKNLAKARRIKKSKGGK